MTMPQNQKYCTHCGKPLLDRHGKPMYELFDVDMYKKSNILKLVSCSECGEGIADRYCEFDGTLLLIDLVLQSREAYRHVLYNGGYNSLILKMALLTVICDGYICWSEVAGVGEFFEQEYQFYIMCSKVTLALIGYLSTVIISSQVVSLFSKESNLTHTNDSSTSGITNTNPELKSTSLKTLCLGLLMAYSSRFFNLMALLWSSSAWPGLINFEEITTNNKNSTSDIGTGKDSKSDLVDFTTSIMWAFIYLLFFVSSVRVHQVTQKAPALSSMNQLFMGHVAFVGLLNIDNLMNLNKCL